MLAPPTVAQMAHHCPAVKRDETAKVVGWLPEATEGRTMQPARLAACLDRA